MSVVLAHAGRFTWDEALMVLAPMAVIFGILALANRRAAHLRRERTAACDAAEVTTPTRPTERGAGTGTA